MEIMDSLKGKIENAHLNGNTDESTHKTHYLNFRNKAQKLLKISRCQSRRIYEILQLYLLPRTPEAVAVFERALHKRTVASYERARTDAMCGRAVDRRRDAPGPGETVSMVFGELADECYTSQVAGYVTAELEAYQAVVRKLDRLLHSPSIVKNDRVTCDT
ncbi:unnamed protein product [Dicrocoelium dendriticum]|nr:unnamed protein product [Dicrocoelium dendriticum]